MIPYDAASFSAGQDTGTRVAACVARLAAIDLMDGSRWWNRRRRRLMASALVAHAEEMEDSASEPTGPPGVVPRLVLAQAGHRAREAQAAAG